MARSNSRDFLGGLFDFDGDGHTDAGEMFLAYMMFEEATREEDDDDDDEDDDL